MERKYDLFTAIQENNFDSLKKQILEGASLAAVNDQKKTPIQFAYHQSNTKAIETIIDLKKDENDAFKYGAVVLLLIRDKKGEEDEGLIRRLLHAGASMMYYDPSNVYNALHWAIERNKVKIVQLLLENNCPLTRNGDYLTPLELACKLRHWDCVKIFLLKKKIVFMNEETSSVAYWIAVKAGELTIADELISAGAIPMLSRIKEHYHLHWLAKEWDAFSKAKALSIALYLLNTKLDQNWQEDGLTAIELASKLKKWDYVQLLIKMESLSPKNAE